MKSVCLKKIMTAALAAACVLTAVPVTAAPAKAGEMEEALPEEAEIMEEAVTSESMPEEEAESVNTGMIPVIDENEVTELPQQDEEVPVTELPKEDKEAEAADPQYEEKPADEAEPEKTEESEETEAAEPDEESAEPEEAEPEENLEQEPETMPVVSYCTHVQSYGWQDYVSDGEMSGTSGEAKRLEGIRIKVEGVDDLHIEYQTHVQSYGWQDYVADGATAGTTGQAKRLEAIRIRLTGAAAKYYDIYYCVHVQTYGWLNWAKNNGMAGTAGYSKRLEGICIKIQKKGDPAPASLAGAVSSYLDSQGGSMVGANDYKVIYNTHVQTYGWQDWVGDGALGGTSGQSKRLEGIHIRLQNQEAEGSIEYRTHVQSIGWQDWVSDGKMAGTSGQAKRLEAIQIRLTGEMASKYDVWYRTHIQSFGWRGWAKNGEEAGSQGYSYRMEAVEIKLLPKGSEAPGSTADPFSVATIRELYPLACARLDQIGWDLRKAFIWSASMPYYRLPQDISYGARFFATFGFQNGKGDCYVMAACFYEMAKALGYDAHWMFGYVPMAAGGLGIHSWVEIVYNGATYICDPDYTHESGGNGYMITYGSGGWGYYNRTRMN